MQKIRIILLIILLNNFCSYIQIKAQNIEKLFNDKIITATGSMGINAGSYNVNGISPRDRDFRYSLTGGVNVNLLGINFPFSMVVSEQQATYTQPSNQYGVSPNYKWVTLHAGWRSLTYSQFTLAGHTFLGGGFDLTPGNFRISGMYGRLKKASTGEDINAIYNIPTYERIGYAAKFGYGTSSSYFDLIILKAKDNVSSLDSSFQTIVKPEENMVLGLSGKLNLISSLFLEMELSSSLFTNDTRSESIPDSNGLQVISSLQNIYNYKMSSQLTTALQTSLAWRSGIFGIKATYKRIDPNYKSMGSYFFESDVENILIAPNVNFFNRTLRLTGSLGLQRDNLLNTKRHQSQRIISSAGISFNQPNYGIDLKYSSYGITQHKGLNPLIDSLKIARVNNNINGSVRLSFQTDSLLNNIIFIGGYQTLEDLNSRTAFASQSDNYMANIAYQGNLLTSGLSFGVSFNYTKSITNGNIMEFLGPSAQIGKTIDDFNISSSLSYQFQSINSESNGGTTLLNLQAGYKITQHQSINLNFNIINSGNNSAISPAFSEYRSNLGYIYNF